MVLTVKSAVKPAVAKPAAATPGAKPVAAVPAGVKVVNGMVVSTGVKKTIEKKPAAGLNDAEAKLACKWCKTGKCWNHGQVPKPGVGGEATIQACRFFAKGECTKGDKCTFSHDLDEDSLKAIDLCIHFAKGTCKKGDECTFNHDFDPDDPDMKKRLRQQEKNAVKRNSKGWGKGWGGGWGGDGGVDPAAALGLITLVCNPHLLMGGGGGFEGAGFKGKGKGKTSSKLPLEGCKWCAKGECWTH